MNTQSRKKVDVHSIILAHIETCRILASEIKSERLQFHFDLVKDQAWLDIYENVSPPKRSHK